MSTDTADTTAVPELGIPDPAAIRAQIAPVDPDTAAQFDGDFTRALDEARTTGDLADLHRTLTMWSRIARRITMPHPPAGAETAAQIRQRLGV